MKFLLSTLWENIEELQMYNLVAYSWLRQEMEVSCKLHERATFITRTH